VAHFNWCDDFGAARNCALAEVSADWHPGVDADNWLAKGGPALAAFRGLEPDFVGVLHLVDRSAPAGLVNSWLSQVLPANVRYCGSVHE